LLHAKGPQIRPARHTKARSCCAGFRCAKTTIISGLCAFCHCTCSYQAEYWKQGSRCTLQILNTAVVNVRLTSLLPSSYTSFAIHQKVLVNVMTVAAQYSCNHCRSIHSAHLPGKKTSHRIYCIFPQQILNKAQFLSSARTIPRTSINLRPRQSADTSKATHAVSTLRADTRPVRIEFL
jgi:hypothetical protein